MRVTLIFTSVVLALAASNAWAQRGMGDEAGVTRNAVPDVRGIAGTVADTKIGPCADTTGRAIEGAHLVLDLPDGQSAELHLGPADASAVNGVLDVAEPGTDVRGRVFRTDAMPFDAFVAVTVTIGDTRYRLREKDLQPTWAPATGRGGPAGGGAARDNRRCWWGLPSFN